MGHPFRLFQSAACSTLCGPIAYAVSVPISSDAQVLGHGIEYWVEPLGEKAGINTMLQKAKKDSKNSANRLCNAVRKKHSESKSKRLRTASSGNS